MRRHPDFSRPLPRPLTWRDSGWMLGALLFWLLLICAIYVIAAPYARAHDSGQWETSDPAIRAWYHTLMQPDNKMVPCCGEADAYYADQVETGPNGELVAVITDTRDDKPLGRPHVPVGTKIIVPRNKIKFDAGNPVGRNIIFLSAERKVYCFVDAGGV
jgi:hypothetical protein